MASYKIKTFLIAFSDHHNSGSVMFIFQHSNELIGLLLFIFEKKSIQTDVNYERIDERWPWTYAPAQLTDDF